MVVVCDPECNITSVFTPENQNKVLTNDVAVMKGIMGMDIIKIMIITLQFITSGIEFLSTTSIDVNVIPPDH